MHKTLRLTFSKTTMAAVGIACLVPHWPSAAEVARVSGECATPEHRQLEFGIGDRESYASDAPDAPSVARARVEPIAEGCGIRKLHEQSEALVGGSVTSYDPLRKRWQ